MIGCTQKGLVCFISDAYGGGDHQIIERSDLVKPEKKNVSV